MIAALILSAALPMLGGCHTPAGSYETRMIRAGDGARWWIVARVEIGAGHVTYSDRIAHRSRAAATEDLMARCGILEIDHEQ